MTLPQHIEIFGIGGGGKTTVFRIAAASYKGTKLVFDGPQTPNGIRSLTETSRLVLAAMTRKPLGFFPFLTYPGASWLLSKLGYRMAAFRHRRIDRLLVLVDSGLWEPLVSHAMFYGRFTSFRIYQCLLEALPSPVAAVHLTCNVDVAYGRFIDREHRLGRLANYNLQQLRGFFDGAVGLCNEMDHWCAQRNIPLIRLPPFDLKDDKAVSRLLDTLGTLSLNGKL